MNEVDTCVAFLRANLLRIAETPDYPIDDMARELRDLVSTLEHLDPDYDRPIGERFPCTAPHPDADGRDCGYRIVVDMAHPADDITCRRCGNTTTAGRIILTALNDPRVTVWAYPADIADTLGIPKRTLQRWGQDGDVRRNGSRYDVGAAFRKRHKEAL